MNGPSGAVAGVEVRGEAYCLHLVESEVAAVVPTYVNRPAARGRGVERPSLRAPRERGRRQAMRVAYVALRAYEQRAERRAVLRAWRTARAAPAQN
jgi:hypothetical protein